MTNTLITKEIINHLTLGIFKAIKKAVSIYVTLGVETSIRK